MLTRKNKSVGTSWLYRFILLSIILCSSEHGFSQYQFDFNESCRDAYREIFSLKLETGRQLLEIEKKKNPRNLIPTFLESYIDFFILFFNEDPEEYENRKLRFDKRLQLISKGPENSPYYLLTKSIMNLHWAAIQIKFGHNWDAGWAFRRSYIQSRENVAKFPGFTPSYLYSGIMQVAAGTIPQGYKWLSSLMGIKGSIQSGIADIESFLSKDDDLARLFRDEGIFYYLYLKFYVQNDKEGVFSYIEAQDLDLVNNHMFAYQASNLRINNQQADKAEVIIKKKNSSPAYMETPVWDLEMGYIKSSQLDPASTAYFQRFISEFKGKFYVKDALQKLSWMYYLQGNMDQALHYRKLILKKGGEQTESDKQAQKAALTTEWPNEILLKARLQNDGGYLREALRLLHGKSIEDFTKPADRLEFCYRVARLYDDLGNKEGAIKFYIQAISLGKTRPEHFAARSALQLGYLYEKSGNCTEAVKWFETCMEMKNHDFKDSLDQRAKAGIKRCRKE